MNIPRAEVEKNNKLDMQKTPVSRARATGAIPKIRKSYTGLEKEDKMYSPRSGKVKKNKTWELEQILEEDHLDNNRTPDIRSFASLTASTRTITGRAGI